MQQFEDRTRIQHILDGFGKWHWDVSFEPSDVESKIINSMGN